MEDETDKQTLTHTLNNRRPGDHMTEEERKRVQGVFLEALGLSANVRAACMQARIARATVYAWQEHDEEFSHNFKVAQKEANDLLFGEAWRRAVHGTGEPVVSMGKAILDKDGNPVIVKKYSDSLLMFIMRARMPEFREKQQVEHSGSVDFSGAAESLFAKVAAALPKEDRG